MNLQVSMIFSPSAELLETVDLPERAAVKSPEVLKAEFLGSLTEGDRERFERFCSESTHDRSLRERMAIFRISEFYGSIYAFAEKVEDGGKVYVTLLKTVRRLKECLAAKYIHFFSANSRLSENEIPLVVHPPVGFVKEKAPSIADLRTTHTNILELTQKILCVIEEDPVFFGNKFTVFCEDLQTGEEMSMKLAAAYMIGFSPAAYIHVMYAVLAALMEATVSHVIEFSVRRAGFGVEIELRTRSVPMLTGDSVDVTDLNELSAYAEYSEPMIAFAEALAESNSFNPLVRYFSEDGCLSVLFRIGTEKESEGEFHYRDPYENLSAILGEASEMYRSLSIRFSDSLHKEKQS